MVKEVLLFGAVWCGNCSNQKKMLEGSGVEVTYLDVDTPEGAEKATEFGVRGLPLTVIVYEDGKTATLSGVQSISHIIKESV